MEKHGKQRGGNTKDKSSSLSRLYCRSREKKIEGRSEMA
jgi:hypothetical protein